MLIDGLLIDTNRDGIDLDCCRNVHVTNCHVNSPWDDAICPKASYALGHPAITENITIDNCIVSGSHKIGSVIDGTFQPFPPAPKSTHGRIKLGTESNGGFRNITVANCVFDTCRGLRLKRSMARFWKASPSPTSPCAICHDRAHFPAAGRAAAGAGGDKAGHAAGYPSATSPRRAPMPCHRSSRACPIIRLRM
jgi:hypothetical protein